MSAAFALLALCMACSLAGIVSCLCDRLVSKGRWLMRISTALFGLAVVCFLVFAVVDAQHQDEGPSRPTVSVRHERISPAHSRCDECPQPGDILKAHVAGSSSTVHGIAVYRDDGHVHSCIGCDDLDTVADGIGRYAIIGFQLDRRGSCELPCAGLDPDIAALMRCGAAVDMTRVDVR